MFTSSLILHIYDTEKIVSGTFSQLKANIKIFRTLPKPTNCITMIAIPNHFRYSDLDKFVGGIKARFIRYFRNTRLNNTFVIFYFDALNESVEFYKQNNGRRFTEGCNEICHLFYVDEIEFENLNGLGYVDERFVEVGIAKVKNENEMKTEDEIIKEEKEIIRNTEIIEEEFLNVKNNDDILIDETNNLRDTNKQLKPNNIISNTKDGRKLPVQLPSCPVCLQKLDQSTGGVLTIQCTHTFHCSCLSAWKDLTCPVCRSIYSNNALKCADCNTFEKLWACLICGKIGCDRYTNEHAKIHAFEHNHFFAIEVGTEGVWDYINETYVHRVMTDEGNKIVVIDEIDKVHEIRTECEILMIKQLELQKEHFEEKIKEIVKLNNLEIEELHKEMEELNLNVIKTIKENETLNSSLVRTEIKLNYAEKKVVQGSDQLKHSKRMNELLMKRMHKLENKNEELKNEIDDLCGHVEAQSKIMQERGDVKIIYKKKKK